jgi:hypothetical protein
LKGADVERAATLRVAAEQAGCQSVLALAEIKETWDVLSTEEPWHHDWYDDDDDEYDDAPDHGEDDYELNELVDDEIVLGWWVSPDGGAETICLALDGHEVCAVTQTKSLTPYETEYEGYMGNYGNTLERWYRRAAVVVWPKKKAFAARADAGAAWALRTLLDLVDAGDLRGARADAASLEPFWLDVDPALLAPALEVAAGLRDATVARVVMAPFRMEMLSADHAPLVAALARAYGDPWLLDLIDSWESSNRFAGLDRLRWLTEALLPMCQALREHEANPIAAGCADRVWLWLSSRIDMWVGRGHPDQRRANLGELAVPLAQVLEAASDELGATIAEALRAPGDNVDEMVVPVLPAHRSPPTPALVAIADDCRSRLTRLVDRPARAEEDWSITWTGAAAGCVIGSRRS